MHKKTLSQDFKILKSSRQATSTSRETSRVPLDIDRITQKKKTDLFGKKYCPNGESNKCYLFQVFNKADQKSDIILKRYRRNIKVVDRKESENSRSACIKVIKHKNKESNISFDDFTPNDSPKGSKNLESSRMYEKRNKSQIDISPNNSFREQKYNSVKSFVATQDKKNFHNSQIFEQKQTNRRALNQSFDQQDFRNLGNKYIFQQKQQDLDYFSKLRNYDMSAFNQKLQANRNQKNTELSLVEKFKKEIQFYSRRKL